VKFDLKRFSKMI